LSYLIILPLLSFGPSFFNIYPETPNYLKSPAANEYKLFFLKNLSDNNKSCCEKEEISSKRISFGTFTSFKVSFL
jgi:hypothetical protein